MVRRCGSNKNAVLDTTQRLELRIELSTKLSDTILDLFGSTPDAPEKSFAGARDLTTPLITEEELRQQISQYLRYDDVCAMMTDQPDHFSVPDLGTIQAALASFTHKKCSGDFVLERDGIEESFNLPLRKFLEAMTKPETTQIKLNELREIARTSKSDTEGLFREMNELQNALRAREVLQPSITAASKVIAFALTRSSSNGEFPLRDFMRDLDVFRRLTPIFSDRLQARFVKSFDRLSSSDTIESKTYAILNVVGEYALVTLGVVSPELFQVGIGNMFKEDADHVATLVQRSCVEVENELHRLNLRSEGTFFFSRYKVNSRPTNRVTEALVRDFITETVRRDSSEVLAAINYQELFASAQKISQESGKTVDEQQGRAVKLREILIEALTSDEAKECFLRKLTGPWYTAMHRIFFTGSK